MPKQTQLAEIINAGPPLKPLIPPKGPIPFPKPNFPNSPESDRCKTICTANSSQYDAVRRPNDPKWPQQECGKLSSSDGSDYNCCMAKCCIVENCPKGDSNLSFFPTNQSQVNSLEECCKSTDCCGRLGGRVYGKPCFERCMKGLNCGFECDRFRPVPAGGTVPIPVVE